MTNLSESEVTKLQTEISHADTAWVLVSFFLLDFS